MDSLFDLSGTVAVLTGAQGGIGRALALGLARFGADLILADLVGAGLGEIADQVQALGREALAIEADLTQRSEVDRVVAAAVSRYGRIDILVNSLGRNIRKPATEVTEEDWDQVLGTNLRSVFFCTQAIGRVMIQQQRGKVVSIASVMGLVGSPDYQTVAPYCASKGGVVQLTKALALEWARHNIQVNALAPATVATPLVRAHLQDPVIRARIEKLTPMGRLAEPEELVGPVIFLASRASSYVTGSILCVDGGWLAQ
jgi:NAD(P)-dependent dehydrogenase (short-subunit alcohol dehydrogenase family)